MKLDKQLMNTTIVTFFGECGCGKTSLIKRYVQGIEVKEYEPTIEDFYNTTVDLDGKEINLKLIDTASGDSFKPLRDRFIEKTEVFVFVYSVDNYFSFKNVEKSIELTIAQYKKVKSPKKVNVYPSFLVVANKIDTNNREVSMQDGKEIVEKISDRFPAAYYETSAKENLKVDYLFETIARGSARKRFHYKTEGVSKRRAIRLEKPIIDEEFKEEEEQMSKCASFKKKIRTSFVDAFSRL
ncbi:ras, putative [Entamoeba invadens IP1]|uniref:ras, putative n=1 Tax=Entamoeba invadens IP1 TaxID=370355 RepID=UPI0002C3EA76|nr:ras, putative [Entamoeba invadens IP1]ELP94019.1 ras, putative [Entamoeba invadens IP1]|eukprot:XP_004260790.1 ras, putative [Entamoeba invadens IP1]